MVLRLAFGSFTVEKLRLLSDPETVYPKVGDCKSNQVMQTNRLMALIRFLDMLIKAKDIFMYMYNRPGFINQDFQYNVRHVCITYIIFILMIDLLMLLALLGGLLQPKFCSSWIS